MQKIQENAMILEKIIEKASKLAGDMKATDVRAGLTYTGVKLENGSAGVALTFRTDLPNHCIVRENPFAGSKAADLISMAVSNDLLERTIAIAAANAVFNTTENIKDRAIKGDTLKLLQPSADETIGMVGYFGPLVDKLKGSVKKLMIFEKNMERSDHLYHEEEAFELLPTCDKAIITSTSLINMTMEKLLESCRGCKTVALVGSTTPLCEEIFSDYKVDLLSGIVVENTDEILRIVSEGGGTRVFKNNVSKVNLQI